MKHKTFVTFLLAGMNICQALADNYIINTTKKEQKILHFGASDAWSMQFIGLWREDTQRQVADWLFSTSSDKDGNPVGIGLSVWRFNLGAGSAEQGDKSQINPNTRTECFLQHDGTYDWNKQAGQRRFLHLAKERGVDRFLAFMNSVPVYFTDNGLATNTGRGKTMNIKGDCYDKVAEFTAKVLKGIEEKDGIHFDYICPVNEPEWEWLGPKQEGSPATNREVSNLVRAMGKALKKENVSTNIIVSESGDMRFLTGSQGDGINTGHNIADFFCKDSADTYIGNCSNVPKIIVAHSYWSNTPVDTMKAVRKAVRNMAERYGVKFWQTETCIMSNDGEIGGGHGFDKTMKTALYVARIIHNDLVFANAESWSWWRAVGGNYKDGLIRAYTDGEWKDGRVEDSKLLWALGNYSRFIRPGAVRYDVNVKNDTGQNIEEGHTQQFGTMCSAYRNNDGSWVVVAINYSDKDVPFTFMLDKGKRSWIAYRTSGAEGENLKLTGKTDGNTTLPSRSVTTFVSAE